MRGEELRTVCWCCTYPAWRLRFEIVSPIWSWLCGLRWRPVEGCVGGLNTYQYLRENWSIEDWYIAAYERCEGCTLRGEDILYCSACRIIYCVDEPVYPARDCVGLNHTRKASFQFWPFRQDLSWLVATQTLAPPFACWPSRDLFLFFPLAMLFKDLKQIHV